MTIAGVRSNGSTVGSNGSGTSASGRRGEEWGEEYALGDLGVGISGFLVDSASRFIDRVIVDGDPATLAQVRVAAIRLAVPLVGHELLA